MVVENCPCGVNDKQRLAPSTGPRQGFHAGMDGPSSRHRGGSP